MKVIILLNSIMIMLFAALFIYKAIVVVVNNERVTNKVLVPFIISIFLLMLHPIYFIGLGPNNPFLPAFGYSEGLVILASHLTNYVLTALLALIISGGCYLIKKRFLCK